MSPQSGKVKRALGVQSALEWAFRVEKARLDLPPPPDAEEGFGFGLEYVLMQPALLGCRIDGGQHKIAGYTHEDAEVIAATVTGLPGALGGKRMAIHIAELARAGIAPDWMPDAVPRCLPVEVKRNQHGVRASTMVASTTRVLARGKWRTVEMLACPVTWRPHPQQIIAARRNYDAWWQALDWIRDGLIADDGELIAGHGRVLAAELLGISEVPVIRLGHLDEAERRAYRIADNKLLWLPPMVQGLSSRFGM